MQNILNKAKSKMHSLHHSHNPSTSQNSSESSSATPIPYSSKPSAPQPAPSPTARISWPPRAASITMLDEIKDTSGRNLPRDLGRSITLRGHHFYMFADTFCFSHSGDFVGLTSNTCAYIPDKHEPTRCTYWNEGPREPEFIPMIAPDHEYNTQMKGTDKRVANWAFGGVIEEGRDENGQGVGNGKGWIWNDRVLIQDGGSVGLELVRVELDSSGPPPRIRAEKRPGLSPFGKDDIKFGNMDTFIDRGWVYLLGSNGKADSKWPRNAMARLPYGADLSSLQNYQYHTESRGWVPYATFSSPCSTHSTNNLTDVLSGIGHGMIFRVGQKGPPGKPYMCIGVDKFLSSKLVIGCAERPEGPWDLKDVGEVPRWMGEKSKTRYCLYMHEWGSDLERGELLVSWSDDGQMGGLVVAARLKLAMEG